MKIYYTILPILLLLTSHFARAEIVKRIHFEGNSAFGDDKLRNLMLTREGDKYNLKALKCDLEKNVISFYKTYGYPLARISRLTFHFFPRGVHLWVTLEEENKEEITVASIARSINFDDNSVFSKETLKDLMKNKEGERIDYDTLQEDLDINIISHYKEHGYSYARISELTLYFFSEEVYLWITIDEGKIGRITVKGNNRTKEHVIIRELLFKKDSVYNKEDEEESERILRKRSNFGKAEITTSYNEITQRVDVQVEVADLWTFFPAISFPSFSGGDSDFMLAISDSNMFGLGQSARIRYNRRGEDDEVKHFFRLRYAEPRLFGLRWQLHCGYSQSTEGETWKASLKKPLYSLKTRWAAEFSAADGNDIKSWYENGQVTDEYERNFHEQTESITRVFGSTPEAVVHESTSISLWHAHNKDEYLPLEVSPASEAHFENRDEHTLGITLQQDNVDFIEETFINKMGRVEDIPIGYSYGISIGYTSRTFGSDEDKIGITLAFVTSHKRKLRHFISAEAGIGTDIINGEPFQNSLFKGEIRYLLKDFMKQTLAMKLSFISNGKEQILLGGNNGLRGYKARQFSGNKRILLNVENRLVFYKHPLIVIGGAVFTDVGYITSNNKLNLLSYKRSIGAGLRIALPKLNDSPVYRLDFAYALDSETDFSSAKSFSIEIGHAF